jgi:hypothetical protein
VLQKDRRGSENTYVMENSSTIEPLPDDADDTSHNTMTAATSDYDPSIAPSSFCSVSSSVNGHVWEYGRYVTLAGLQSFAVTANMILTLAMQTVSDLSLWPLPTSER